jgi:hypothetical protein
MAVIQVDVMVGLMARMGLSCRYSVMLPDLIMSQLYVSRPGGE